MQPAPVMQPPQENELPPHNLIGYLQDIHANMHAVPAYLKRGLSETGPFMTLLAMPLSYQYGLLTNRVIPLHRMLQSYIPSTAMQDCMNFTPDYDAFLKAHSFRQEFANQTAAHCETDTVQVNTVNTELATIMSGAPYNTIPILVGLEAIYQFGNMCTLTVGASQLANYFRPGHNYTFQSTQAKIGRVFFWSLLHLYAASEIWRLVDSPSLRLVSVCFMVKEIWMVMCRERGRQGRVAAFAWTVTGALGATLAAYHSMNFYKA